MERGRQFDDLREDLAANTKYKHEFWERISKGSVYRGLQVYAEHPKFGRIGEMDLVPDPDEAGNREIWDINVTFRRKGIGTGLMRYAQAQGLNPVHSALRTDQGEEWAKSVGGDLPPRQIPKRR